MQQTKFIDLKIGDYVWIREDNKMEKFKIIGMDKEKFCVLFHNSRNIWYGYRSCLDAITKNDCNLYNIEEIFIGSMMWKNDRVDKLIDGKCDILKPVCGKCK